MKETQPKSRGGRPQKFPGEGPRITHATRLRPATAAQLAEEAERNHRSLGEEIEYRIGKSFDALVIDLDKNSIDEIKADALKVKCSFEEYVKRVFSAYKQTQNLVEIIVEALPNVKAIVETFQSIKVTTIGLIILEVMDVKGLEISKFLQHQIMPPGQLEENIWDNGSSFLIVSQKLKEVEDVFKEKFNLASMDEIYRLIDDVLISYVKKHSGHEIRGEDILKKITSLPQ